MCNNSLQIFYFFNLNTNDLFRLKNQVADSLTATHTLYLSTQRITDCYQCICVCDLHFVTVSEMKWGNVFTEAVSVRTAVSVLNIYQTRFKKKNWEKCKQFYQCLFLNQTTWKVHCLSLVLTHAGYLIPNTLCPICAHVHFSKSTSAPLLFPTLMFILLHVSHGTE